MALIHNRPKKTATGDLCVMLIASSLTLSVLLHRVRLGLTGLYFTLWTGQDKPVNTVVCVSLSCLLLATLPATVINELSGAASHSTAIPQPKGSATSNLVSRICLLCDLKEAVFCPFLCGCVYMVGSRWEWAFCFANSPLLLK